MGCIQKIGKTSSHHRGKMILLYKMLTMKWTLRSRNLVDSVRILHARLAPRAAGMGSPLPVRAHHYRYGLTSAGHRRGLASLTAGAAPDEESEDDELDDDERGPEGVRAAQEGDGQAPS